MKSLNSFLNLSFLLILTKRASAKLHHDLISANFKTVCMWDMFQAHCASNQVVLITKALYGQMDVNDCSKIKDENCVADVIDLTHSLCSGRQSCEFKGSNPKFVDRQPCNTISYLEISYNCINVAAGALFTCTPSNIMKLSNDHDVISSYVTDRTGCGSMSSPVLINAIPGQQISLSLTDFGFTFHDGTTNKTSEVRQRHHSVCIAYGFVVEKATNINKTICGGDAEHRSLMTSNSHSLEVYVLPYNKRKEKHFLLHYTVVGCSDFDPQKNFIYTRHDDKVTVTCKLTQQSWYLTCRGNQWSGVVGNCSNTEQTSPKLLQSVLHLDTDRNLIILLGLGVVIVLLTLVALIGCILVIKRRICSGSTMHVTTVCEDKTLEAEYLRSLHSPHFQYPHTMDCNKNNPEELIHIWESPLPEPLLSSLPHQKMFSGDNRRCATQDMRDEEPKYYVLENNK